MKRVLSILAAAFIVGFYSCEKSMIETDLQGVSLINNAQNELKSANVEKGNEKVVLNFRAHLTGKQEVPANESAATGQVVFKLKPNGEELTYRLIVANIENVLMAHIHVADAGTNGPVATWLYPSAPPATLIPGTSNGILNEGVITKANLIGSLAGKELSELVNFMKAGRTYVNVHTSQFPGGEIRGQVFGNGMAE